MRSTAIQPAIRGANVKRLNPQQQQFVKHLLADPTYNATKAARKAGYKTPPQDANRLMKEPIVLAAVGKALQARLDSDECSDITAIRVLRELASIGFCDPRKLFDETGNLLPIQEMPEEVARAISSIEVESHTSRGEEPVTTVTTKIKFWSKNNALELIAKHLGMLDERLKVEHGVSEGSADLLHKLLSEVENARNVIDVPAIEAHIVEE